MYTQLIQKVKIDEGDSFEQEILSMCKSQVKLYEIFDVYQI